MDTPKTILVTTDFSDTARVAFPAATMLARAFDARVVVVYVDDDRFPPLVAEYMAVGMDEIRHKQHERAREQLAGWVRDELASIADVRLEVPLGVPHVEIVRVAEECGADLIVMSTHGRGFISHAIMGSTTERVLRRAPCPVLAVKAAAD